LGICFAISEVIDWSNINRLHWEDYGIQRVADFAGTSFLILSAFVGLYITSTTILLILEDTEAGKEEVHGLTPNDRRAKGANLEKVHPLTPRAEPSKTVKFTRRTNANLTGSHQYRFTELRKLRHIAYVAAPILLLFGTIPILLSFTTIKWRNKLVAAAFVGVVVPEIALAFNTYSVFKYYGMLIKSIDNDATSAVKDHLKASMRYEICCMIFYV
jgi:hypothetical protein